MKKLLSLTLALFLALGNLSPIAMAETVDTQIVPDENITEGETNTNPVPEVGEAPTEPVPEAGEVPTEPAPMAAPMMVPMALKEKKIPDGFHKNEDGVIYGVAYKKEGSKDVATDDTIKKYIGDDNLKNYYELELNTHITKGTDDDDKTKVDYHDNEFYYVFLPKNNKEAKFCFDKITTSTPETEPDFEYSDGWATAEDTDGEDGNEKLIVLEFDYDKDGCVTVAEIEKLLNENSELNNEVTKDDNGKPEDDEIDIDIAHPLVFNPKGTLTVVKREDNLLNWTYDPIVYEFDITFTSNKSLEKIDADSASKEKIADGHFKFTLTKDGSIKFTGIPSDAKYTLTELSTGHFTTEYKVDDNASVNEIKDVVLTEKSDSVVVTNTYKAPNKLTGTNLKLKKNFVGVATAGEKFSISVTAAEGNTVGNFTSKSYDVEPGKSTDVSLGDYTKIGKYIYNIKEKIPDGAVNGFLNGIQYDTKDHHAIVVTVGYKLDDNGAYNGELYVASAKDENGHEIAMVGNDIPFTITNTKYTPVILNGEANLKVTKNFTGRANDEWLNEDKFEFNIKLEDGIKEFVEMPANLTITANKDNKNPAFGDIKFTNAGVYSFIVNEVIPEETNGITYDNSEKRIKVEVADAGNGQLTANIATTSDELVFNNTYSAEPAKLTGETGLHVKKILTGRPWKDDDKFEFKLEPVKDYGNDISINADESTAFATNDKAVEIGDITFNKAGTYEFKLYEVAGSEKYMHYDTTVRNITVSVNDNKKGKLEVTAVNGNENFTAFEFENVFVEENLISITKQVAKTTTDTEFDFGIVFTDLEGKKLSDDEVNFNWTKGEEKGKFTKADDTFNLADDETIVIELPENLRIKVTEKSYKNYSVNIKVKVDNEFVEQDSDEVILAGGEDAEYEVTNTYSSPRPKPTPRPNPNPKPNPKPYPVIRPIEIPSTGANI